MAAIPQVNRRFIPWRVSPFEYGRPHSRDHRSCIEMLTLFSSSRHQNYSVTHSIRCEVRPQSGLRARILSYFLAELLACAGARDENDGKKFAHWTYGLDRKGLQFFNYAAFHVSAPQYLIALPRGLHLFKSYRRETSISQHSKYKFSRPKPLLKSAPWNHEDVTRFHWVLIKKGPV